MKTYNFVSYLTVLILLSFFSCANEKASTQLEFQVPKRNHDLAYIPFDSEFDKSNYTVCDSTNILSGRNRIKYEKGTPKLKKDIISNFLYKEKYKTFNGFIVIRFLVNCENETGRYRAEALNYDFSPAIAPDDLLISSLKLIKGLDNWKKSSLKDEKMEYLKFINLRFRDGEIQNVLL